MCGQYPPGPPLGGIGTFVGTIAPALANRGHEVHVLACAEERTYRDSRDNGVHVHSRPLVRLRGLTRVTKMPYFGLWLRVALTNFIESRRLGKFDVIEYPNWQGDGLLRSFFPDCPVVCTLHSSFAQIAHVLASNRRDAACTSWLERLAVNRASYVATSSSLMAAEARELEWRKGEEIEIVERPVEWRRWSHIPSAEAAPPKALFLGRMEPRKAPEILVEAIGIVRRDVPQAKAVFAGQGDFTDDGKPLMPWANLSADTFSGCEFEGFVSGRAIPSFFEHARVIVQPSRFESFGLAAAEGMAAGRAAIVTDTCGIADFVRRGGGGDVVPAGDAEALARALKPYLIDPDYARAVGERARDAVRRDLDPDRIAQKTEEFYERARIDFFGTPERARRFLTAS
jgi:glycogen synthase